MRVNEMTNARIILCKAGPKHVSPTTKLRAKLYRQHLVDLKWIDSRGQHGDSIDHPLIQPRHRRSLHDNSFTPSAKSKHQKSHSMLEAFSAEDRMKQKNQKEQASIYKVSIHRNLETFFGAVTTNKSPSTCKNNKFLVCTLGEVHELRETAAFKFGCQKESSPVERCVSSFDAFLTSL